MFIEDLLHGRESGWAGAGRPVMIDAIKDWVEGIVMDPPSSASINMEAHEGMMRVRVGGRVEGIVMDPALLRVHQHGGT